MMAILKGFLCLWLFIEKINTHADLDFAQLDELKVQFYIVDTNVFLQKNCCKVSRLSKY